MRIVITGYGCLTASGENVETSWNSIKNGRTGIDRITLWDAANWKYPLGAEIKNYSPQKMLADRKLLKMLSRHDVIGLNAVSQALEHSQLLEYRASLGNPDSFNDRTGVYVSSPGNKWNQQNDFMPLLTHSKGDLKAFGKGLFDQVHPMWLLRVLPNNVLAYTGIQYGFKGPNQNIVNHGVGGLHAINEAVFAMKAGMIDRAAIIGYEAALEPAMQLYYAAAGLISNRGVYPFDESHDGTVLGEGAGCMILETLASAEQRGARIYGEILGQANTSDALGIFQIEKEGKRLSLCMEKAVQAANLRKEEIAMITAHGNGNIPSDDTEAYAINQCFTKGVKVTGFKWSIGHTLSAAGVIETILTLLALKEKRVPAISNLTKPAHECAGMNVAMQSEPLPNSPIGLVINRGFGGHNSCLVLRVIE